MKTIISAIVTLASYSYAFAAFAVSVPMQLDKHHWQSLKYNSIPANQVTELAQGLQIRIDASASPLIYVFDETQTINQVSVKGMISGLPVIPQELKQGEKGADDFPFRLGLVLEGDKTLNFVQRLIAAQWVKILFGLAPEDTGIDHIMFLNLANQGFQPTSNILRKHPGGKGLITETYIGQIAADQDFNFSYNLRMPEKVIAFWISADGDDTGSSYALTVNSISYE
jgi:hypothetical protein